MPPFKPDKKYELDDADGNENIQCLSSQLLQLERTYKEDSYYKKYCEVDQ